jgi:hypothetical protein
VNAYHITLQHIATTTLGPLSIDEYPTHPTLWLPTAHFGAFCNKNIIGVATLARCAYLPACRGS